MTAKEATFLIAIGAIGAVLFFVLLAWAWRVV